MFEGVKVVALGLDPIDRDFRKWVIEIYRQVRGSKR